MPLPPPTRSLLPILAAVIALGALMPAVLAAPPQRIVSLSPGVTETLFALGLGDRVVGDTVYCDYPPAAKTKTRVGDVNVNYEAVLGLRPDLVIVDRLANEQAVPRLEALHVPLLLIWARSVPEVQSAIITIGDATGAGAAAKRVVAKMRAQQLEAVSIAKATDGPPLRTLVVVGSNPLYVAGSKTFVGEMVEVAGAANVAGSVGFVPMSKETAVADNPQVIFCGAEDTAPITGDPAWSATDAVRNHNFFTIDSNLIFRPGPRLTEGMILVARDLSRAKR